MVLNLKEIWKDPVWSKVIATIIITLMGILVYAFLPNWKEVLIKSLAFSLEINILILIVVLGDMIIVFWWSGKSKKNLQLEVSSASWFSEIENQIKECNSACIYLREFSHPDQFKVEHRDSLLSFMTSLAERLNSGADIKIIAYHSDPVKKTGLDWLKTEIGDNTQALSKIRIIQCQPKANSTSMYLFDSGVVLYNRRVKDNKYSYHNENMNGSIIHFFIERGFCVSREGIE